MKRLAVYGLAATMCLIALPTGTWGDTEMIFRGRTTTQWIAALASESLEERVSATWSLGEIGEHATRGVPGLLNAIGDPYAFVRHNAIEALGKIGPGATDAVPKLLELMASPEPGMRWRAAQALGRIGPQVAGGGIPLLTTGLTDTDREMRIWSATSLGKMGPSATASTTALVTALTDTDVAVRYSAAHALGLIGSATPEVIAALRTAAADPVETVRRGANDALVMLGQQPVPPPTTTPATPTTPAQPADTPADAVPVGAIYEWPGSADVLRINQDGIRYPPEFVTQFTERFVAPYAETLGLIALVEQRLAGQGRTLPEPLVNLRAVLQTSDYLQVNIITVEAPVNGVAQPLLEAYVREVGAQEPLRSAIVGLPGGQVLQGIPIMFNHTVYADDMASINNPLWADADAILRGPQPPLGLPDPYLPEHSGHKITAQRPIIGLAPFIIEATKTDNTEPRRANLNCAGRVALRNILDANNITPELLGMDAAAFHSKASNLQRMLAAITMAIGCSVGAGE